MKYYYKLKDGSFRIIEDEAIDAIENIKDTIKAIETMYREEICSTILGIIENNS